MEYYFNELRNNWKSGLSVALVSIPLSLSLSIASGAGPIPGIVTAIWGGLIASIFGGSRFNIVGPAGALSTILASYALYFGTAAVLPILAILAGIFILLVWFLRWDRYLVFVPSPVIHGFTLGVAISIAAGQINSALGLTGLPKHPQLVLNILESLKHIFNASPAAVIIFVIGLVLMFLLFKLSPKIPNSIIVAALGIIIGLMGANNILPFHIITLKDIYGTLSLHLINPISFQAQFFHLEILKAGAIIGFVAVLETLISAKVADGMTKTKYVRRKEVLGAGLANIGAGLTGGLPGSGVFARTALNIRSGATSQYSQMINAIAVAAISLVFIPWFSYMPMAVVASILIYACVRMVQVEHFSKLYKFNKGSFGLAIFVAVIMIFYDATTGIIVGTLISLIVYAQKMSCAQAGITAHYGENQTIVKKDQEIQGSTIVYRFAGELTYLNAASHIETLNQLQPSIKSVVFNMRNLFYIDIDGLDALDEIVDEAITHHKSLFITGVHTVLLPVLETRPWFIMLKQEGKVLDTSNEALKLSVTA